MRQRNFKTIRTAQQRQCDIRLQNDTDALEATSSERMQVTVGRFGNRIRQIHLLFPGVQTAFFHCDNKEVTICSALVEAKIDPNSGNTFPYPLGAPMVRILYPNLKPDLIPWLSGLYWIDRNHPPPADYESNLPSIRTLVASALERFGERRVGLPCLWREGEWNRNCDLIFVARQIHRLLTDPRDYSPNDSMNPEAAVYWATHRDQLPLEPPIIEIYGKRHEICGKRHRNCWPSKLNRDVSFELIEVE